MNLSMIFQRLIFFTLSLVSLWFAVRFYGIDPVNHISLIIFLPTLLATLALLQSWRRPIGTLREMLMPRNSASRGELMRSTLLLQSLWRHLWQIVLLLVLLSTFSAMHHFEDINVLGHSLAILIDGLLFLLLSKGLVFLPAEIRLRQRLRSQPAID